MTTSLEDALIADIKNSIASIAGLTPSRIEAKNEDSIAMIKYFTERTDQVESRRIRHYEFSVQLFSILVAATGVLITIKGQLGLWFWLFVTILGTQAIFALITIAIYIWQSGYRYPFLKVKGMSNQWKWFYYGNEFITKIVTGKSGNSEETTTPYLQGLRFHIEKYIQETEVDELASNIIQQYLLEVHNYYKNRFYLQLFNISQWSVIATIITTTVFLICALIASLTGLLNTAP